MPILNIEANVIHLFYSYIVAMPDILYMYNWNSQHFITIPASYVANAAGFWATFFKTILYRWWYIIWDGRWEGKVEGKGGKLDVG